MLLNFLEAAEKLIFIDQELAHSGLSCSAAVHKVQIKINRTRHQSPPCGVSECPAGAPQLSRVCEQACLHQRWRQALLAPRGLSIGSQYLLLLGLTAHGAHGHLLAARQTIQKGKRRTAQASTVLLARRRPPGCRQEARCRTSRKDERQARGRPPSKEKGGAGCTYYSRTASPVTLTCGTALGTECSRAHGPVQLPGTAPGVR